MDVSHSRLLKFLLPNNILNMSKQHELKVEYISAPTNVESAVPEQQEIRQAADDINTIQNNGDQSDDAKNDDSTFVPVFKTKIEEAAFTKGDLKLQKVSVTENISDKDDGAANLVNSEANNPSKTPKVTTRNDDDLETKKPRSRIPKLRQAAEQYKQNMKKERESGIPSRQGRRFSIPKAKKGKIPTNKDSENKPSEDTINIEPIVNNNDNGNMPPEEEFDKIFDEIIHNNDEPVLDTNVLVDNIDDAEKLEHSFEEIIHDYEENKMQPINVKQIRNKMLLVKQKSLPEEKFARKLDRRPSLKDIPLDNITLESKLNKLEKKKSNNKSRKENEVSLSVTKTKKSSVKYKTSDSNTESIKTDLENLGVTEEININMSKKEKESVNVETLIEEPQKTILKDDTKQDKDIKNEVVEQINTIDPVNVMQESVDETHRPLAIVNRQKSIDNRLYDRHQKIEQILPSNEDILEQKVYTEPLNDIDKSPAPHLVGSSNENQKEETEPATISKTRNIPTLRDKFSELKHRFASDERDLKPTPKKDSVKEMPPKSSIVSKIARFSKNTIIKTDDLINTSKPAVSHTDDQIIMKNPSTGDVTNNSKVLSAEKINQIDIPKDIVTPKMHRNSIEKLNLANHENKSENPTKLKLNLKYSITPPNTPQVHESEPYKDGAHLAGEPKILNIDDEYQNDMNVVSTRDASSYKSQTSFEASLRYQRTEPNKSIEPQKVNKPKLSARDVYNQIEYDRRPSIHFDSPNPDEFNRAPLFEAVNKKISADAKHVEEINLLKGKVGNIINRIDSFDERAIDPPKMENRVELPVKKSVLSRIAMFERQASTPSESKPKLKLQLNTKPKIIEEVLKAPPPRKTNSNDDSHHFIDTNKIKDELDVDKKDPHQNYNVKDVVNDNSIVYENIENVAKVVQVQELVACSIQEDSSIYEHNIANTHQEPLKQIGHKIIDNDVQTKVEENVNSKEIIPTGHKIDSPKILLKEKEPLAQHEKEVLVSKIKERLKRVKSINEEGSLIKSKSVAELDLGDAVKGKVHEMIVRMKSVDVDKIELEKKHDNINIRERPRKRSVSEKIALFERRLVPVEMETAEIYDNQTTPLRSSIVDVEITTPASTTPKEINYKERIAALTTVKAMHNDSMNMTYMTLSNGQEMPVLVLGTALLDNILLPYVIGAAIDLGYRAIDTAFIYGNEKAVGEAIQAKIEDGTVKREELFMIGKLWSTFHRTDLVEQACNASLEQLGLDYFDLYLIHNPMSFKEGGEPFPIIAKVLQYATEYDYLDAWYGMEEVYKKGLAKGIGVSNFNSVQIARIVEKGKIKPVINQVECHPYLNQTQLDQFCADRNIALMCYGPLGSKGTPKEYKLNHESVIDDPLVIVMSNGLGVTPAQLLIRYQIDRGHAVVTKCSSAEHLWDNLQALTFNLTDAQITALNFSDTRKRKRTYAFVGMGDTHPNYPFNILF